MRFIGTLLITQSGTSLHHCMLSGVANDTLHQTLAACDCAGKWTGRHMWRCCTRNPSQNKGTGQRSKTEAQCKYLNCPLEAASRLKMLLILVIETVHLPMQVFRPASSMYSMRSSLNSRLKFILFCYEIPTIVKVVPFLTIACQTASVY